MDMGGVQGVKFLVQLDQLGFDVGPLHGVPVVGTMGDPSPIRLKQFYPEHAPCTLTVILNKRTEGLRAHARITNSWYLPSTIDEEAVDRWFKFRQFFSR